MNERKAGTYARGRYERGLRSYRRRMRPYTLSLATLALLLYAGVIVFYDEDLWSLFAGSVIAGLLGLAIWTRDEPPELVAKWGRGAEGERKTAKSLRPLLQEGWKVRHDVDLGRGNADHVLLSPSGDAFLLESKALAGRISVERGVLTCRYADDPDEVRRYQLNASVENLAARVEKEWTQRTGRPAPSVRPVVVVWGAFAQKLVQHGPVVFVSGDELVPFLRQPNPVS